MEGLDSLPFALKETVFVPHLDNKERTIHYQGQTKEVKFDDGVLHYLVHYTGWSKKWDEWIPHFDLLKEDDPRVTAAAQVGPPTKGGKNRAQPGLQGHKGRKRKGDQLTVSAEQVQNDIIIPIELKKRLVEEHDVITQKGLIVPLPRKQPVQDVLRDWLQWTKVRKHNTVEVEEDVAVGMQIYFDKALPQVLLYSEERSQCNRLVTGGARRTPSSAYGAEHLLRLFVKLPEILPLASVSEEHWAQLKKYLNKILLFLDENRDTYFLRIADQYQKPGGAIPAHRT